MAKKPKKKSSPNTIAQNKRARFDFQIDQTFEAGLSLQGWEIKSIREGKVNIKESYILLKDHEAFLFGAQIQALITASTHTVHDPLRLRKLLLHRKQIEMLTSKVNQDGLTVVPLDMHWSDSGKVKLTIGLAKGKKLHDKRATEKDREWARDKERVMKLTR